MEGIRMRLAIGTVTYLTITSLTVTWLTVTAGPVSASEAFIAQLTGKAVATEPSSAGSTKTMLSAAMLALPVQPKMVNLPVTNAATAAANTSSIIQVGANNVAAVSQTGSGNASTVVQHGNGNQAMVTQRH
jgi:Curlin associated repeat